MSANIMSQLDANQVMRTVYDPNTGSLLVVNNYVSDQVWVNALAANTTQTMPAVNVLPYNLMTITVVWAGLSVAGGTLQLEGSTNDTNWFNIGSAYTMTGTSGSQAFLYSSATDGFQYIRMVYTPGSTTSGTISSDYVLKA